MQELLDSLIYYITNLGWSIVPVGQDKRPLIPSWKEYQDKKPEIEQVRKWVHELNPAGLAVVTGKISDITVVDIDPRHEGNVNLFGDGNYPHSKTGGDGRHYFFKYDPNVPNGITIMPGVEIKNDGGLIILPPSLHKSGKQYEWLVSGLPNNFKETIPDFIKQKINEKKMQSISYPKSPNTIAIGVSEGNRNNEATRLFGKLLKDDIQNENIIWQIGLAWNTMLKPPLPESELRSVYESIRSRELKKSKGQYIYNGDFLTFMNEKVKPYDAFINTVFPEQKWLVDGLVPLDGITCISGAPKVGKSILTLNLAVSLITGSKFLGQFETQKSSVLYIGKDEPQSLTHERFKKMLPTQPANLNFYFTNESKILFDKENPVDGVLSYCEDKNIKVVIIDSLRRIFDGNENESAIINTVQQSFKRFVDVGINVIFIHHHGKEGNFPKKGAERLRGSSDILAMVDSALMIDKVSDKRNTVSQSAIRYCQPLNPFHYEIEDVDGILSLKYVGEADNQAQKIDEAESLILRLLEEKDHKQVEIIKALKSIDTPFGETTIKNALKHMVDAGDINKNPDKSYSLPILDDMEVLK